MSHTTQPENNTPRSFPVDADKGYNLYQYNVEPRNDVYLFKPSDAKKNSLSLKIYNADQTPIGIKGIYLADYAQEVMRSFGLSQRKINQMTISVVWVDGSCEHDAKTDGFCYGTHRTGNYNGDHTIKMSYGVQGSDQYISIPNVRIMKTFTHELIHTAQTESGRLHYTRFGQGSEQSIRFTFKATNGTKQTGWIKGSGKILTSYMDLGHELEAHGYTPIIMNKIAFRMADEECLGYDARTGQVKASEREVQAHTDYLNFQRSTGDTSGWY